MMQRTDHKKHVLDIFNAAVDAVHPRNIIPSFFSLNGGRLHAGENVFPFDSFDKIYVAGAGKATAAMAHEVEKVLGHYLEEGVIAVRDVFDFPLKKVRAIAGGHPIPDDNSLIAAAEITKMLEKLKKDDLLIFLMSGGASSLMMDIPEACTLEEVNVVLRGLMRSGAVIQEVNTVRKHLSSLKGGQLVKKCSGATVVSLVMSDVIGNDLQSIGSGPTVGDESTFADAIAILEKYGLKKMAPYTVMNYLQKGAEGNIAENPKPSDSLFHKTSNTIVADNLKALKAAKEKAEALGYTTRLVNDALSGYAEDAAKLWVEQISGSDENNVCLIAGGETTVHVQGKGKGGRSQQFALAAAVALKDAVDVTLLAAGTDGSDGPTDAAGAIVTNDTWREAQKLGLNADDYLNDDDAYHFFEQAGGLLKTGATHTNVMDVVVTIVGDSKQSIKNH
jgi:hydroxypyruvate reductase